jgi:hypothetical protein
MLSRQTTPTAASLFDRSEDRQHTAENRRGASGRPAKRTLHGGVLTGGFAGTREALRCAFLQTPLAERGIVLELLRQR